jgi:hypothetical protein
MRLFTYVEPGPNDTPVEITISEDDIFEAYWPFWYNKMATKYGNDSPLITWENCLEDWKTIHWATEKPPTAK